MDAPAKRIESLDGLRGLAALIVVFTHSESIFFRAPMEALDLHRSAAALLLSAEASVSLFFVLSGYVLARSASRGGAWLDIVFFYIRRVFRIHFPYLVALLIAWIAYFAYAPINGGPPLSETITRSRAVHLGMDRLLRSALFPGSAFGQVPAGWTLQVEMVYSIALPAMLWIAKRSHWSLLLALSLALMQVGSGEHPLEWFAVNFCVGIILYLERDWIARTLEALPRVCQPTIAIVGLAVFVYPEYALLKYDYPRAAVGLYVVGSALLMIVAIQPGPIRIVMSTRPMQMLGRISYSVYLLHMPVILLCLPLALELSSPWRSWIAFAIPMAILSCVVGWGFERAFDRHSTRAGHQVCHWLSRLRSDASQDGRAR